MRYKLTKFIKFGDGCDRVTGVTGVTGVTLQTVQKIITNGPNQLETVQHYLKWSKTVTNKKLPLNLSRDASAFKNLS